MASSIHRIARHVTLAGLIAGVTAIAGLIAWTCYVRVMWDPVEGLPESMMPRRGFIHRGFSIIALHPAYALGATIAGALAAGGVALAVIVKRRRRWGFLATGIGATLVIAAPWLARAYVVHIETSSASRAWAARSPYVAAVTGVAIAATVFLAILAAAAFTAFATARDPAR